MQTIYYRTKHFIRHQGNLVDLAAYRQKLSAVSGGDLAPALEEPAACLENPAEGHLRLLPKPARPSRCREGRQTRKAHLQRAAVVLDLCASIAVVALSVAALAAFLAL